MANGVTRRPLPAVISLAALLLLTGIVWWRVLHRSDDADAAAHCSSAKSTPSQSQASPTRSQLPAPSEVTVQVLNSTNRTGLAASVRRTLIDAGFASPAKAADDTSKQKNSGVAQIRYGAKGKAGATYLRYYFPGATLVPGNSTSATVVVALGDKFKKVTDKGDVAAELRRSSVAVAPPTPTPTATSSSGANC